MGGTKKKSITQAEKAQAVTAKEKRAREGKGSAKRDVIMPSMDEKQAIKAFESLGAVTVYGVAKTLAIKASVASALVRSYELKGIVKKAGGYSGHFVYKLADIATDKG